MTDTEKFLKPWYRHLPPPYKCLWEYIVSRCDSCGVWVVEDDVAEMRIGEKIDLHEAIRMFNNGKIRVAVYHEAQRWLIVDFIRFQYGVLKIEAKDGKTRGIHRGIIKQLEADGILKFYNFETGGFNVEFSEENIVSENTLLIPYSMGINRVQDIYKVKDKEKDIVKDKEIYQEEEKEEVTTTLVKVEKPKARSKQDSFREQMSDMIDDEYRETFDTWLAYKKERQESYKTLRGLKTCYNRLVSLSDGNPQVAKSIVEQSIANNYAGLFESKDNHNGKASNLEQRAAAAASVYNQIGQRQVPLFGDE